MKLTRRLIVNVVVFFVAAFAIVVYGVVQFFGSPFDSPRQISTHLVSSSGLRENFSVSHNGIVVGVISKVSLTDDGVEIRMSLHDGTKIPTDVEARVIRASPVGEQRLELEPVGEPGSDEEMLADGDEVPAADDAEPPVVSEVVDSMVALIEKVPPDDLNTVIEEASIALEGRAGDIALFIDSSTALNEALLSNEADFRRLLDTAPAALSTLNDVGDELETSIANSAELSRVLADESENIVSLFRQATNLGVVGKRVVEATGPNLVCLTADLAGLNAFVSADPQLSNLDRAFQLNYGFFGPINNLAPQGPGKDLGLGTPKPDQTWLRVNLLLPPQQPSAMPYVPPRKINDVYPGAACRTPIGAGADAVSQSDPGPLFPGSKIVPPTDAEAKVQGAASSTPVLSGGTAAQHSSGHSGPDGALQALPLLAAAVLVLSLSLRSITRKLTALWFG